MNYASMHKEILWARLVEADAPMLRKIRADLIRNGTPDGGLLARGIATREAVLDGEGDPRVLADLHFAAIHGQAALDRAKADPTFRLERDAALADRVSTLTRMFYQEA